MSPAENMALLNAGYVKIGTVTTADSWQQRVNGTLPTARYQQSAIWTGSSMIVWGSSLNINQTNGGIYNPSTNSWTTISTTGATSPRMNQTGVWANNRMIIWGGTDGINYFNDGAIYNPVSDSWTPVLTTGAPSVRQQITAIWTGNEMIVWGGFNGSYLNDTYSYTPSRLLYLYQRP